MGSTSDGKWTATVASIWIQSTSGSLYTFGIYSAALKSSLSYDQSTLATLSAFKDTGANAGLLSGLLYSAATSSNPRTTAVCGGGGPWIVLLAGAIQCFAGYFLMWLSVTGVVPPPHVLVMCLYMLLAAHAQTFFNTANVVTAVNNFPNYRGTVVGIMKGFLGLSGAILIQVYQTIFKNKPTLYLLMLALLPTFNTLLLMCFVRIYRTSEGDEKKHLNGFSLVSLIIATYLMVVIILENAFSLQLSARIFTFIMLILLLASPLYIAMKSQRSDLRSISSTILIGGDRLVDDPQQLVAKNIHTRHDLGLATVNNISQIGGSLGYTDFETSSLVSLWSIWNFLGRFGAGYVSEYFLHVNGWPRPLFMVITLATMSIGHAVIASGFPGALYVGSILVGVCYGSQWSLMPTIASEIFGVVHMGTIFNTITIASPVGSYILSVRVVGYIYDKEASGEGNICSGTHCFRFSFFILAGAALLGCLAALILFFLTKKFYQQSVLRRLQNSAWE
ncbi:nodulin-like [Actinidia rufa]|uniref:Nodulin-like n=1 Tax=Actinidia rufa TaxID=165716 RepID=A0A7J0GAB7_9ERIC|nr:nodulin-like [Actinidia rufa]